MKLLDERIRTRCDIGACHNEAKYMIEVDENKRHNIHICPSCFDELYNIMMESKTPRSVENVVRRAENRRDEWKNRKEDKR